MKDIIIIGAGGLGRETIFLIEQINKIVHEWNLIGLVDDTEELKGKYINGYQVLGRIEALNSFKDIYAVCSISNPISKKQVLKRITSNIEFATLIHPTVIIGRDCTVGKGVIIQANCILTTNIKIGDHVQLNPQCGIGHDSVIKDYSSLYWNVNISGNVIIEEGCTLGTKATVIQRIKIGRYSFIGAAANVIREVPAGSTAVGNPARVIKQQNSLFDQ